MMKKFVFMLAVAACMVSCLGDYTHESSVNATLSFEGFPDNDKDSLFLGPSFFTTYFAFMNADKNSEQESKTFLGGFGLSSRKVWWSVPGTVKAADAEKPEYKNDNLFMTVFDKADEKQYIPNAFAVFYDSGNSTMPEHDIAFGMSDVGTWTPAYCSVANTAFTVACAKGLDISGYPDHQSKYYKFRKSVKVENGGEETPDPAAEDAEKSEYEGGDYITLVVKGYKDDKMIDKTTKISLVDYRDGKDSVMTAWRRIDLSKFGGVDFIDFEFECSEDIKNSNFPLYFCLDSLASNIHIKY